MSRGEKYACVELGGTPHFRKGCPVCLAKIGNIRRIEKVKVNEITIIIKGRQAKSNERINVKVKIKARM